MIIMSIRLNKCPIILLGAILVLIFFTACSGSNSPFSTKYTKDDFYKAIELGDVKTVEKCIKQGIKINEPRVEGGKLPLSIAITVLNVDIVKMLMDAGADPTLSVPRSEEGQTGVIMGKWGSPIFDAQALMMAYQLTGGFTSVYQMKYELEVTKNVVEPLKDPKFNEKIKAIMSLLTKENSSTPSAATK
jgi:hypothetical protein